MSKRLADADPDSLRSFLPSSFGKKQKVESRTTALLDQTRKKKVVKQEKGRTSDEVDVEAIEKKLEKPPDPVYVFGLNVPDAKTEESDNRDSEAVEYIEVDSKNPFRIPFSHEVELKGHEGIITSLTIDPAGSRLISGGFDAEMKFWDFNSMDSRLISFKSVSAPSEIIHSLNYNSTGSQFLMCSNAKSAMLYSREGEELVKFVEGYPFISNMAATKGHIARVTAAFFHPKKKEIVYTASHDSSIRVWDINQAKWKHKDLIKIKSSSGGNKNPVFAACISHDGNTLACACEDGSLLLYDASGPYSRPRYKFDSAHVRGSETSCLTFSGDDVHLISRGGDDTMKVWDSRMIGHGPLHTINDLPNNYAMTSAVWGPGSNVFATGTSIKKDSGDIGKVMVYSRDTFELVKEIPVSNASVISLLWPANLNQIICGSSDNRIRIEYDPNISMKGAMAFMTKHPKKRHIEDAYVIEKIENPNYLPMFQDDISAAEKRARDRRDPKKSHLPELPLTGIGEGGRLGVSQKALLLNKYVPKTPVHDDPRMELLKFHEDPSESIWFKAYTETQPEPQFAKPTKKDEEAEKKYTNVPKM